jgi:hypothetical protein
MNRYSDISRIWRESCEDRDLRRHRRCMRFHAGSLWITLAFVTALSLLPR